MLDEPNSFLAFIVSCSVRKRKSYGHHNKGLKHHAKLKEQFPNEESLERFVCTFYSEYNRKQGEKAHRGFREATAELLDMFPKP